MTKVKKEITLKTQEELLHERTKLGKLPVIEIAGHPFYVDTRMEYFRPHDDFSTLGIPFSVFNRFEVSYRPIMIAYDPKKHTNLNIDYEKLTEIPADWIMIELPHPKILDPYGYARENGLNIEETLKQYPLNENMKAKVVPWEEAGVMYFIKENQKRLNRRRRLQERRMGSNNNALGNKKGKSL